MRGRTTNGVRTTRRLGGMAVGLLAAVLALLAAPAFACTPKAGGIVSFYPTTVAAGDKVRVNGHQLQPSASFEVFWGPKEHDYPLARGTADASGSFMVEVVIPATRLAHYQLNAYTARTDGTMAEHEQTVSMSPTTAPSSSPPTSTPQLTTVPPSTIRPGPLGTDGGVASQLPGEQNAAPGAVVAAPGDRSLPAAGPGAPPPGSIVAFSGGLSPSAGPAEDSGVKRDPDREIPGLTGLLENADIWAGLDPAPGPSLIDPQPAPPRGEAPVGGLMLAAGVSVLGGAALSQVVSRRRLAAAAGTR